MANPPFRFQDIPEKGDPVVPRAIRLAWSLFCWALAIGAVLFVCMLRFR